MKMAAIHKLSIDTAALFVSRSTNSIQPQSEKHNDVKRSRSHGSSPLPRRMQLQLSRAFSKDNQLSDGKSTLQTSQSPIFSRSSRYSRDNIIDKSEDSPSMSNTDEEGKGRKTSKCENDLMGDVEKKPKKKNSLVKKFLVNRLRSGSWHASSNSEPSRNLNYPEGLNSYSPNIEDGRKYTPGTGRKSLEINNSDNELTGLIKHILDSHLRDETYDCMTASAKCGMLSKILEKGVKSRLNTGKKNFKISTFVYLGEIKDDGIKMATQCAWEPNQDHFAMATYESDQLFASAMVFAVEFDDGYDADRF